MPVASAQVRAIPTSRIRGPMRAGRILPAALQPNVRAPSPTPAASPIPVFFSGDPNAIVTVTVATVQAPTPNTYQQCGCLVSFGATTLAAQDVQMLTQISDLIGVTGDVTQPGVIIQPDEVVSAAWAAGVLTVTTTNALPASWQVGNNPNVVLAGFDPPSIDGYYQGTVTGTNEFTVPITTSPGTINTPGTFQPGDAVELSQMATTFFSQGNNSVVWVLECGAGLDMTSESSSLNTWLTSNPKTFYGYLLPRRFGATSAGITAIEPILKQYQAPDKMTYFWLTVVDATMSTLGSAYKDVIQFIEAPSVTDPTAGNITASDGEFSLAAMFYNAMVYVPSPITMVAPMSFKYLYGVTPYPTKNNGPLMVNFKDANTNYVATGAQGGISNNIVYDGVALDGTDYFNWWWTIDYVQINAALDVANAIINGSNNPTAPLYYNGPGINQLLAALTGTMIRASTYGMVSGVVIATSLSQPDLALKLQSGSYAGMCNVNAVPFLPYVQTNPGHYKIGEYDGLSVIFIPARGFIHVVVGITATNLPNL
jgi:hypothetical protein